MKSIIMPFVQVVLLGLILYFVVRFYNKVERIEDGISVGGLALVHDLDKLVDFKISLSKKRPFELSDLESSFHILANVDSSKFVFLSKKTEDLVYVIDCDGISYYDKLDYKLKNELKIDYRLKFDQWLDESR